MGKIKNFYNDLEKLNEWERLAVYELGEILYWQDRNPRRVNNYAKQDLQIKISSSKNRNKIEALARRKNNLSWKKK